MTQIFLVTIWYQGNPKFHIYLYKYESNIYTSHIYLKVKNEILNDSWKEQCYKIIDYMDKKDIRVILFSSKLYPEKLKHIDN